MKTILTLLIIAVSALAYNLTIVIPDNQIARVVAAENGLYPCPVDSNGVRLYTQAQWAKRCVINHIIRDVKRFEEKEGYAERKKAVAKSVDSLLNVIE